MIRGAADLLEDLGLESPREARAGGLLPAVPLPALSDDERAVLAGLAGPSTAEMLAGSTGRELPRVLAALTALELHGLVRTRAGRYERRTLAGERR
jgi:predicted Rossmann fold nucleotide-binding protein DprA/Smf involved in DNA uptake